MELSAAIAKRRMVRSFTDAQVSPELLDGLLDQARRSPSAGNSQGTSFVVLDTPETVAAYWDTSLPAPQRDGFKFPGLLNAPVLVIVLCSASAYVDRYSEPDKAASGLGGAEDSWSVPYWFVDAGAVVQNLLLGATDVGLGACLFGLFEHEAALLERFGVPEAWRAVGTIALGYPAEGLAGRSANRRRRELSEVVHRNHW